MGCDGGTIPRRDELVRLKKKPEQKDKDSELSFRWRHCAVSQQALQEPVVGCALGRLYSKSALIEALLDKSLLPDTAKHIRNLKDVKDLNLTPNPAYKPDAVGYGAPYICPVIGLEMTGRFRFIFLWSCGCVFSERALKFVSTTACHNCQIPFTDEDVIVLNGTEEDISLLKINMETRNAKLKAEKKAKKNAKVETIVKAEPVDETINEKVDEKTSVIDKEIKTEKKCKESEKIVPKTEIIKNIKPGTSNASTSKLTGSKLNSTQKNLKRTALGESLADPEFKKSKDAYSVSKDPKATEVFKSIFTSHNSAAEQDRAHWITYNPFYN